MRTFLLGVLLYIAGLMLCVSLLFAQHQEARMSLGVVGGSVPAAAAAYDPATDASIIYWFKSDWSGAALDAGAAQADDDEEVVTWVASKGGANATTTTTYGPFFRAAEENGLGMLEGVTGDYAQMKTSEQASIAQPFTIWVVFKLVDLAHTNVLVGSYDATPSVRLEYTLGDTVILTTAGTAVQLFAIADTNIHILRVTYNGASSTYQLDGGASTAFSGSPGTNGYVGISFFNDGSQGYASGNMMGEVLIQDKAPSAGEDTAIRTYLNDRWNVY